MGTFYDVSVLRCTVCGDRQYYNYNSQRCEYCQEPTPILYNGACSACPAGTHYDAVQQRCLSCPETYIYNTVTGNCVCPQDRPYSENGRCIACLAPRLWNGVNCVSCPETQIYNTFTNKC